MTTPARYKIYGGTGWKHEGWVENGLDNRSNMWHSASDKDPRGVRVEFEKEVTISRFEGLYFEF